MLILRYAKPCLILWLLVSSSATPSFAQAPGSIIGHVLLPSGGTITQSVKVSLETIRGVKSTVFTDNDGGFAFRPLNPGSYQVVVEADRNSVWDTTIVRVEVFPGGPTIVNVVLKEKKNTTTKPKGGDSITATELDAAIPPKARKEFDRATDAGRDGKVAEAIAHLRKAIEYFPNYLQAHNDLGTQLLAQNKLEEAEVEFRKGIAIDAKAFNPHLNLGIVLVQQKRFKEATETLKETVAIDPSAAPARLYYGEALVGIADLEAAIREFTAAHELGGKEYSIALFRLGLLHSKMGQRQKAVDAFESYINEAPTDPNVAEARRLLASLRSRP